MSDVGYTTVQIDTVGTYVSYQGGQYEVTRTATYQDAPGQFTTIVTLHPIDDEMDRTDEAPIEVNTDTCDIRVI